MKETIEMLLEKAKELDVAKLCVIGLILIGTLSALHNDAKNT